MSELSDAPSYTDLEPTGIEQTAEGRMLLKYLVNCAMPKGTNLRSKVGNETYDFKGDMGLAPEWLHTGMNESHQRLVSACILARTNYFGQHIRISMRLDNTDIQSLKTTPEEEKEFPIYEGAFFGNIFVKNASSYTCLGNRSEKENKDDIFKWRVCTQESGNKMPDGEKLSKCNFIITGLCSEPKSTTIGKDKYTEVIKVYLKPGLSSLCNKKEECS